MPRHITDSADGGRGPRAATRTWCSQGTRALRTFTTAAWTSVPKKHLAAAALLVFGVNCGADPSPGSASYDPHALVEGQHGKAIVAIAGLPPQEIEYVVRGGLPIHSGDIIVSPQELSGLADPRTTAAGRRYEAFKWPNGNVPYEFDSSIPVGDRLRTTVADAMTAWSSQTPITFSSHTPGSGGDYVLISKGTSSASSTIGYVAGLGAHSVTLFPTGPAYEPIHELGHILGLYHEQQRVDRNQYIIVYDGEDGRPDLVGGGNEPIFQRYTANPSPALGNDGVDLAPGLDVSSIMIYPSMGYCGGSPCMTTLNGSTWGQNQTLSQGDVDGINRIYLVPYTVSNINPPLTPAQSLALTSSGGARVDALALRQSDHHVLHEFHDDNGWDATVDDFGAISSNGTISAVSSSTSRFDWITRSTNGSSVFHGWRNGSVTSSETFQASSAVGTTITRQPNGTLDAFAVMGSSKALYQKINSGSGWSSCTGSSGCLATWPLTKTLTGYTLTGRVAAVSWATGRLDLIATSTSGALLHMWWNSGGAWQGPEVLATGVSTTGAISITSWGAGRLDLFYFLPDGSFIRRSYEGGFGTSYTLLPGGIGTDTNNMSAVAHALSNENRIDFANHFPLGNDVWQMSAIRR